MNGSLGYRPATKMPESFKAVRKLAIEKQFQNLELGVNGAKTDFYPGGQLLCEAVYKDGQADSPMTIYYESGKQHTVKTGKDEESSWFEFDEAGKLLGYCTPSSVMSTWPDGSLHFHIDRRVSDGKRHGVYKINREDGEVLYDRLYIDGEVHSSQKDEESAGFERRQPTCAKNK